MNNKYLIEKSNILNNFKCKPRENMTLNELRFFCMYVSKLNPCDPKKREIEIKLKDFEEIFKYEDKINVKCEFCNKEYNFYKNDFEKRLI